MPLTYDRAFGGIDKTAGIVGNRKPWCERNYLGKGFCGARTVASINGTPLPNIEDPDDLIRTWDSNPRPPGCGFFPRNSRPRVEWFGTYDEKWKAGRKPELPLDFRFDAYNGADLTMQGAPFLVGNERVHVSNVSPDGQPIFGLLPCLQPTLSTSQPGGSQASLANLDSLVLIPEHSLLYAVWRATLAGDLDEVSDIRIEYAELPAAPLTEPAARLGGSVRR